MATSTTPTSTELAALREELAALRARVDVLEGKQPGPKAAAVPAAAAATAVAATPAPSGKPAAPETDPEAALRSLVAAAFALALEPIPDDPDEADAQFARFAALMHSERRGTPLLEQSLRNYTWRQLRRNANIYLNEAQDPASFESARMVPTAVTLKTERAKLFLRARTRMPTPISLRRDASEHGAWRIESSSL